MSWSVLGVKELNTLQSKFRYHLCGRTGGIFSDQIVFLVVLIQQLNFFLFSRAL